MTSNSIVSAWLSRLLGRPIEKAPFAVPAGVSHLSMSPDGTVVGHIETPWIEAWHGNHSAKCVSLFWEGNEQGEADGALHSFNQEPTAADEFALLLHVARAHLTLDELQSLARIASNHNWVRWWAHWNYPANPSELALSVMDASGSTLEMPELLARGFSRADTKDGLHIYVCNRVDDAGHPWVSKL